MTHETTVKLIALQDPDEADNVIWPLKKQLSNCYGTAAAAYRLSVEPQPEPLQGWRVVASHPELDREELQARLLKALSQVLLFQWKPYP